MNLVLAILLIILEAIYEGLKCRNKHITSEIIELVFLCVLISFSFFWLNEVRFPYVVEYMPLWKVLGGYVLLRLALFDLIFNISAGVKLTYIGTTKLYDKILQKIVQMGGVGTLFFIRFILLVIALAWFLNIGQ